MKKNIVVLPGDGIGQEVMPYAVKVLQAIGNLFRCEFEILFGEIGGAAFENQGTHFPQSTLELCQRADAVLFGSVGGPVQEAHLPKWKDCERNSILAMRQAFQLSTNLRPIQIYSELSELSPLKSSRIKGVDILILRELVGDIYFGAHTRFSKSNVRFAEDSAQYDENQIQAIAHQAFQFASKRRKKVTSVDKANVLETSRLWREVVAETALHYPNVTYENMLVDNCAMQLILNPAQFDVILTSNLFGDILSDEAAAIPGSLGLMPSASLNASGFGLYEPSGGSAPDIAGKNIANPIAQILCTAMMLRHSFQLDAAALKVEKAVQETLALGFRTQDIYSEGTSLVGTDEMAHQIIQQVCGG